MSDGSTLHTWKVLIKVYIGAVLRKFPCEGHFFYVVTWGLTAWIAEPVLGNGGVNRQKNREPSLGNVSAIMKELLEALFSMRPLPRLYRKAVWTSLVSLRSAMRVWGWREMVASLWGREPGSRGTSAVGSNVTENTGLCIIVRCSHELCKCPMNPINPKPVYGH
jgi:hypothetical protein